jgi:hypothetical protein
VIDENVKKTDNYNGKNNRGPQSSGQFGWLWGGKVQGSEGFDGSAGLDRTTRCTTND